ncbi:hypothetical protein Ppa06_39990 [Planomonospora parontospora subsp. parontospora]|uniref:MFS transporter n=2 Tax=Planomonospora parontospora TaxID=58119 RepID=A0AA37F5H7_9ACTN|nr:hypothetical protein GCM10010126_38930 [Planomonospora parontospora]GII10201.1 hypothetical protein Ppa06_39990 [Planomonospora parontospora subsp. parontospora]
MVLHGAWAQEQLGGDLPARAAVPRQPYHLEFLRCEPLQRVGSRRPGGHDGLSGRLLIHQFLSDNTNRRTDASGQGAFAARATAAVPDRAWATAMGLFNLCYLLGAAFGPAIAAALTG